MTSARLNTLDTDSLLERKGQLVRQVFATLRELSLPPGYPFEVMVEAKKRGLDSARYVSLLEVLLEIESIKYTLCARLLPHVGKDEPGV